MFRFKKMTFIIGLVAIIVISVKKSEMLSGLISQVPGLNKI
jgi:hypothetical protein